MKLLVACLAISFLLVGCGNREERVSVDNSATRTVTEGVNPTPAPTPTPTATPSATSSPAAKDAERSVDFTFLGITPDKQNIHYKIKVNTAKPISQVDLATKYMDASGKVLEETTIVWQNIVHSKRQPIERGKTYEDDNYLPEGATRVECVLKRVVFEDGTYWNAEKP